MEITEQGARFCHCRKARIRAERLAKIPPKFADLKLDSLEPNPAKHPKQAEIIPFIKANPGRSYVFAGRFGCGKSLMLWMLYRYALKQTARKVVATTLAGLLDEYREVIKGEDVLPSITAAELMQAERPYSVFLDDIDKARPTEYAAEQFFAVANAIYDYQHQLVVTTNLSVKDLIDHFNRADPRYGGAIVRRLVDNAKIVEMF